MALTPTTGLRRRQKTRFGSVGNLRDSDAESNSVRPQSKDACPVTPLPTARSVGRRPKSKPVAVDHAPESERNRDRCGPNSAAGGGEPQVVNDITPASVLPQLIALTRQRSREQKLRIGLEQTALATVKNALGYGTWFEESERKAIGERAENIVRAANCKLDATELSEDDQKTLRQIGAIVVAHYQLAKLHDKRIKHLEKPIIALVEKLPIAAWIHAEEQRGLGCLSIASILGETGDLNLYDSPSKVFKRMGCAPFRGKAPSTWRRTGGLSAKDWEEVGYSPRRRAMMHVIANNLFMLNKNETGDLPYRARFVEAKRLGAESHPDWKPAHAHAHGNLLCAKRLLRELWRAWRNLSRVE